MVFLPCRVERSMEEQCWKSVTLAQRAMPTAHTWPTTKTLLLAWIATGHILSEQQQQLRAHVTLMHTIGIGESKTIEFKNYKNTKTLLNNMSLLLVLTSLNWDNVYMIKEFVPSQNYYCGSVLLHELNYVTGNGLEESRL